MGKKLWSVFTDDMDKCYFTQSYKAERHHVYPGIFRKKSEAYGYVIPLVYYLHKDAPESAHDKPNSGIDLKLKQMCQEHFEENHGNREDFIREFGRNYID
jgi:hypothetical protein